MRPLFGSVEISTRLLSLFSLAELIAWRVARGGGFHGQ